MGIFGVHIVILGYGVYRGMFGANKGILGVHRLCQKELHYRSPFNASKHRTHQGEDFLVHDSGPHTERRFIILGSIRLFDHLAVTSKWYTDGTFKTAPQLFKQVIQKNAILICFIDFL